MKGKLQYLSKDKTLVKSWVVWYNEQPDGFYMSFVDSLPLHPNDVKIIDEWRNTFDNIDARLHGQEVEFEIVKENVDTGALEAPYIKISYARLINKDIVEEEETSDEEISDEEIENLLRKRWRLSDELINACKWYRDQP